MARTEQQTELLRSARKIVAENPERHEQGHWFASLTGVLDGTPVEDVRPYALKPLEWDDADEPGPACGTTGCVAGWICILAAPKGARLVSASLWGSQGILLPGAAEQADISAYAQSQAGLSEDQADYLFASYRSREEILDELDRLIEEPEATDCPWDYGDDYVW